MSKLWFTADLHFGHEKILSYTHRPWPNVAAMNAGLVERWNEVVGLEDVVIVLGDLAMGKRAESVPIAKLLNGHKILVSGNHDNCWAHARDGASPTVNHVKVANREAKYMEWGGLTAVWQPPIPFTLAGQKLVLTHMPDAEAGDHTEELRFGQQRPSPPAHDEWMLCGHVHEAWHVLGRRINVGVDVNGYAPVAASEVLRIIVAWTTGVTGVSDGVL